jgi:putative membrane protein
MNKQRVFALAVGMTSLFSLRGASAQRGSGEAQTTSSTGQLDADKAFVQGAAKGGYAEVRFGQLAAEKASDPKVKAFGEKMVVDHGSLNDLMRPFDEKLGVLPVNSLNKKNQAEYDKLNGLSGPDFDKEYVAAMVEDHRKDLAEFRREGRVAAQPGLKDAVLNAEKVIAEHHRMVNQLAIQLGVSVPATHRNPPPPKTSGN